MADSTSQQLELPLPNTSPGLLSFFQAYSSSQLKYSLPEDSDQLHVIWSQNMPTSDDLGLAVEWDIHEKIRAALCELQWCSSNVLIQFWSSDKTGSEPKLSCCNQPFALHLGSCCSDLRLKCSGYEYELVGAVEDNCNLPVIASELGLAGVCMDMRVCQHWPFVPWALQSGFISYFALPIFSRGSANVCVGVVDCYTRNFDDLLTVSISLTGALQKHGLEPSKGQNYLPHEALGGLKSTMDDIAVAVRKICESHDLTFAQVSLAYQDASTSSSSMQAQDKRKTMALTLMVPCVEDDAQNNEEDGRLAFVDHADMWDMLPIKSAKGLVEKALASQKPYFCSDMFDVPDVDELLATKAIKRLSSFVVCLRTESTHANDLVFEFFWSAYRNAFTIIESIISRLRKRLPGFKFSSGVELCDPISVVEVGHSSESDFLIFEGGKLAGVAQLTGDTDIITQKDIEAQFQCTQKEAAKNLNITVSQLRQKCERFKIYKWQRTKKRKTQDADQTDNNLAVVVPPHPFIKAEYKGKKVKCRFPTSSQTTLEALKMDIALKYGLTVGQFELSYVDEEGDVLYMVLDADLKDILQTRTIPKPKVHVQDISPMDQESGGS